MHWRTLDAKRESLTNPSKWEEYCSAQSASTSAPSISCAQLYCWSLLNGGDGFSLSLSSSCSCMLYQLSARSFPRPSMRVSSSIHTACSLQFVTHSEMVTLLAFPEPQAKQVWKLHKNNQCRSTVPVCFQFLHASNYFLVECLLYGSNLQTPNDQFHYSTA